jgi:hypothetical protein
MMKNKYLISLAMAVPIIISGVSYFKYSSDNRKRIFSELTKEYPPLTFTDSLDSYVLEIHQPHLTEMNNNPNRAFVTLSPYKKHFIMVGLELGNGQLTLDEILKVGDLILKKPRSNRIKIVRLDAVGDSSKFDFVITDYLGYSIKADSLRN